jgi:hypothetical protein
VLIHRLNGIGQASPTRNDTRKTKRARFHWRNYRRPAICRTRRGWFCFSSCRVLGFPLTLHHVRYSQWFMKQKQFLDSLESQIKSLVKALETSSKQRLGEIVKSPESRRYTLSDISGGHRPRQRFCCSLGGSTSFGRVGSVLGIIAGATPFLPIERRRALST